MTKRGWAVIGAALVALVGASSNSRYYDDAETQLALFIVPPLLAAALIGLAFAIYDIVTNRAERAQVAADFERAPRHALLSLAMIVVGAVFFGGLLLSAIGFDLDGQWLLWTAGALAVIMILRDTTKS